jgi:hypothetical protein
MRLGAEQEHTARPRGHGPAPLMARRLRGDLGENLRVLVGGDGVVLHERQQVLELHLHGLVPCRHRDAHVRGPADQRAAVIGGLPEKLIEQLAGGQQRHLLGALSADRSFRQGRGKAPHGELRQRVFRGDGEFALDPPSLRVGENGWDALKSRVVAAKGQPEQLSGARGLDEGLIGGICGFRLLDLLADPRRALKQQRYARVEQPADRADQGRGVGGAAKVHQRDALALGEGERTEGQPRYLGPDDQSGHVTESPQRNVQLVSVRLTRSGLTEDYQGVVRAVLDVAQFLGQPYGADLPVRRAGDELGEARVALVQLGENSRDSQSAHSITGPMPLCAVTVLCPVNSLQP